MSGVGKLLPKGHIRPSKDWYRIAQIKSYPNYVCIYLTLSCNAWRSTTWCIKLSDTLEFAEPGQLCYYSATALNPSLTMSGPKKRKVDSECWVFNKEWTTKYLFTFQVWSKAVGLICQETITVLKENNISCHFSTKCDTCTNNQSM